MDKNYFLDSPYVTHEVRARLLENPYIYVERIELIKELSNYFASLRSEQMANYLCAEHITSQIYYTDFDFTLRLTNKTRNILGKPTSDFIK